MLTREQLVKELKYNPFTGIFQRINMKKKMRGQTAGHIRRDGYVLIGVNYSEYLAHRLAWLYMYGVWPKGIIDHVDGDPSNNAIHNLRDTSQKENILNSKLSSANTSGHKGIYLHECGRWCARISDKYLGLFGTIEEAVEARTKALETYIT